MIPTQRPMNNGPQRPPQQMQGQRPNVPIQQHPVPPRPVPVSTAPIASTAKKQPSTQELESFGDMMEDLIGTRAAYMLDDKLTILGKIPVSELISTIKSLNGGIYAAVLDDIVDKDLQQLSVQTYTSS